MKEKPYLHVGVRACHGAESYGIPGGKVELGLERGQEGVNLLRLGDVNLIHGVCEYVSIHANHYRYV